VSIKFPSPADYLKGIQRYSPQLLDRKNRSNRNVEGDFIIRNLQCIIDPQALSINSEGNRYFRYKSLKELAFLIWLDNFAPPYRWKWQPNTKSWIPYASPIDGSMRKYFPDFFILERSGQYTIVEIKSTEDQAKAKIQLRKKGRPSKAMMKSHDNSIILKSKIEKATMVCKQKSVEYLVLDPLPRKRKSKEEKMHNFFIGLNDQLDKGLFNSKQSVINYIQTTSIGKNLKRTAIQDLLKKAITSGYWTQDQFNQWLGRKAAPTKCVQSDDVSVSAEALCVPQASIQSLPVQKESSQRDGHHHLETV
jgi:hypothetical protein